MHCAHLFLRLIAVLSLHASAIPADKGARTEKTYCVGRTESVGKLYRYCRELSVIMTRSEAGLFTFAYDISDDAGNRIKDESGQISLTEAELKPFATILYQAWDLVYNRSERRQSGSMAMLEKFRGEQAYYLCDAYGTSHLTIKWPGATADKPNFLSIPLEGVCATLSILATTTEGAELVGEPARYRAGLVTKPIEVQFKEKEEIELSRSIVKRFDAGNWDTWKGWVVYENLDFRKLSDQERSYLSKVFARRGPPSEAFLRMNSDTSFIVRLKLSEPETLKDLREAFRVGYFDAADAADACRRAANVKLLPIAAEFLFTDNAPKGIPMSDVIVEARPSIHAAAAVGALLVVCPEFPESVRVAAKTWQRYGSMGQDFLLPCRKWWKDNQQAIERGRYDKVTAPDSHK